MKRFFNHWGNFIILGLIIFVVYSPTLFTFFAQDDFTHLAISQVASIQDLVNFFSFKTEGIYYRPVSVQLTTWFTRTIFGLRSTWFHALALGLHIWATIVVKKILDKLTTNENLSWWGALFYGVHPMHFMSLFWWAEVSMVMAPLFSFLAILAWLNNKTGRFLAYLLLALLSNELAISVIPVAFILKRDLRKLIPAGLMALVIVGGRWLIAPPSLGSEYGMKFLPQVAMGNLKWQAIRAIGFPEGFGGQMQLPMTALAVMLMGLSILILVLMAIKRRVVMARFWLGALWFVAALLPVLFLEHHQAPIYGIIGLPGFLLMLSPWLIGQKKLAYLWLGTFVVGAFFSVRALEEYHWVTNRAREAEYYIEKLRTKQVRNGDTVVFINKTPESSLQAYIALGAGNGVRVWFGDKVQTYFENVTGLPGELTARHHYVVSNFKSL